MYAEADSRGRSAVAPRERGRAPVLGEEALKVKRKRTRAHGGCLWLSEAMKDVTSCEKPR